MPPGDGVLVPDIRYDCWGGPADGMVLLFAAADPPPSDTVYLKLPIRSQMYVCHTAPPGHSAGYRLDRPTPGRAQWCGDIRIHTAATTEGSP